MAKKRRTPEQVAKLVAEIDALRAGGMAGDEACDKVGLARSVYARAKKKVTVSKPGLSGKIDARSLPPRPKKGKRGGYQKGKPVDMNDIASVANRIAKLDKKLRDIDGMVRERINLVGQLVKLLKKK